jgi:hypothetical protein
MNLLVAFFKEGEEKIVIPLREDDDPQFVLGHTMLSRKMKKDNLRKSFVIKSNSTLPELYLGCLRLHEKKLIFDTSYIIEANFDFWLAERSHMLRQLDVEFMRAIEESDTHKKREVVLQKKFMRDLPNFVLRKFSEQLPLDVSDPARIPYKQQPGVVDSFDVMTASQQTNYRQIFNTTYTKEQVLRYTPFYNILFINVIDPGSGYQSSPTLKFECNYDMAFPPQYQCFVQKGKLKEVQILTAGCGYIGGVKITASSPNDPNGKRAVVSSKIFHEIKPEYPAFN